MGHAYNLEKAGETQASRKTQDITIELLLSLLYMNTFLCIKIWFLSIAIFGWLSHLVHLLVDNKPEGHILAADKERIKLDKDKFGVYIKQESRKVKVL